MKFDYYLSEMSVSDLHGGGLTLQRIIQDDLTEIPYFVHLSRFAVDFPVVRKFSDRSSTLMSFWEQDMVRSLIGKSLASSISKNSFFTKLHSKKAARFIQKKINKDQPWALVCPQNAISIYTVEELKHNVGLKYISWIMDDHLVKFVNGEWHYPKGIEQIYRRHLQEAEHVFVISQTMQDFYLKRFGIGSTILFGSAELLVDNKRRVFTTGLPFKIGYFGAVAAWQLDALQCVANSLVDANAELNIYSGIEKLPAELSVDGVLLKGRLGPDVVLSTMLYYDAILLPISFSEKMRNMSEFNIATKMSEYLASGVPILAVGPEYSAMIKYLKKNNAAVLVESNKEEDIKKAFRLFSDEKRISEILENARMLVLKETGRMPMHKRWLDVINKCV